jgi:large subunit ribosomal protein L7A
MLQNRAKILLTITICGAKIAECVSFKIKPSMNVIRRGRIMSLEEIKRARVFVAGTRQTMKALENGSALAVYIAGDADEKVTAPVVQLCREKGIQIYNVDTMAELGKACNIKVGAAVAAIIER